MAHAYVRAPDTASAVHIYVRVPGAVGVARAWLCSGLALWSFSILASVFCDLGCVVIWAFRFSETTTTRRLFFAEQLVRKGRYIGRTF